MKRVTGAIVLGLSACGYPLTQLIIRRWGMLRRAPAVLLFLELGAAIAASLAGLPPLLSAQPASSAPAARTYAADSVRRAAAAALFAIHTIRFGIYLRPDQGRRPEQA
jgi:hypothetical protein